MPSYWFPFAYLGCLGSKNFQNAWCRRSKPISCSMKKSQGFVFARCSATSNLFSVISNSSFFTSALFSVLKVTSKTYFPPAALTTSSFSSSGFVNCLSPDGVRKHETVVALVTCLTGYPGGTPMTTDLLPLSESTSQTVLSWTFAEVTMYPSLYEAPLRCLNP